MVDRGWESDWYDPFRFFDEEYSIQSWDAIDRCLEPLIEVQNRENEIVVTVDLPCVDRKEDIRVDVGEDSIEISAVLKTALKWERWGTFHKRIEFNSFRRFIRLPAKVDPERSRAVFKRGILRIVLPKVRKISRIKIT